MLTAPADAEKGRSRASVDDLYGPLAAKGWGVVLPAALSFARRLGITTGQYRALEALLLHHRQPHEWVSVSLGTLARDLGVKPQAAHTHVQRLVRRGLIARKPDPRYGQKGRPPYFYSLEPYLAVLALSLSRVAEHDDARLAAKLVAYGSDQFLSLEGRVEREGWEWSSPLRGGSFEERRNSFLLHLGLEEV
jgi:DNA-binding MarR family transcriptional regulator